MGSMSIWHWLIVLVIVLAVFGTKKLKNIGEDLGHAVKSFKDAVKEDSPAAPAAQIEHQETAGRTIEGEVKDRSRD